MLRTIALYAGLAAAANAGPLEGFLTGEMAALRETEPAAALPEAPLETLDGELVGSDFAGRPTVVNFWATWCAPCRIEMPHLEALSAAMPQIEVVTIAPSRDDPGRALDFLASVGAVSTTNLRDPGDALKEAAGVAGWPTTLVLDAEGREVARLSGIADWSSPEAMELLGALAD